MRMCAKTESIPVFETQTQNLWMYLLVRHNFRIDLAPYQPYGKG